MFFYAQANLMHMCGTVQADLLHIYGIRLPSGPQHTLSVVVTAVRSCPGARSEIVKWVGLHKTGWAE